MNHIIRMLAHITYVLTNQLIMASSKGCIDVAYTIEANRLVVGNAVTELADMSEVSVDICLILAFSFVREDL